MLLPLFSAPCFLSSFLLGSFSCFLPTLLSFHPPSSLFPSLLFISPLSSLLFCSLSSPYFIFSLSLSSPSPCFFSLFPYLCPLFFPFLLLLLVSFPSFSPLSFPSSSPCFLSFPSSSPCFLPFFLSLFPSLPPPPG